jgi:hypothetical protein
MKPGISVQHTALPTRRYGIVRCDIAGILGFIPKDAWPTDATAGDFLELTLRRTQELLDHPLRRLFDAPSRRAVRAFFDNGGDECHLYGVCLETEDQLLEPEGLDYVLGPLLERLRGDEEIGLLAVPAAAYMACEFTRIGGVVSRADMLYKTLLLHCRTMVNRFLIIDAPKSLHGPAVVAWLQNLQESQGDELAFGAVYYPWLKAGEELMPPSGSVLGVFARTEREHAPFGVVWPPANTPVRGVTHLEVELDFNESGELAAAAVNPIVVQPGRGVLVFGARTLSTESRWEYINSRRIVSMIAEQLRRDNEWVVFEQNSPSMWKVLERDVKARLDEFWQAGMLTGEAAGRDYLVRCDAETNPKEARETGQMAVEVRLRPITTTEHITIDLRLGEAV